MWERFPESLLLALGTMPTVGCREASRVWNGHAVEVAAVPGSVASDSRVFEESKEADIVRDGEDTGK